MKIKSIRIKGFRSFEDATVHFEKYCVLVGENNSGKSNVLYAIQTFLGERKLQHSDLKKGHVESSYIEMVFYVGAERSWFDAEKKEEDVIRIKAVCESSGKHNVKLVYQYSIDNSPCGKLNFPLDIVFIPALETLDGQVKTTSNSTIMKLINRLVVSRIEGESTKTDKFKQISHSISELSEYMNSDSGGALKNLKTRVERHLLNYPGLNISFTLKTPSAFDFVKQCFDNKVLLEGHEMDLDSQGMGFQRSLIYALLSALSEVERSNTDILYLIEEPELYLHPNHQLAFRNNLSHLSKQPPNQVILTTHSPYFVSNVDNYSEIARVVKKSSNSEVKQITLAELDQICTENGDLMADAKSICDPSLDKVMEAQKIKEDDSLRYLLWMDPRRANCFFSKKVLLVEGPTEIALCAYVLDHPDGPLYGFSGVENLVIIDVVGKFHVYKFAKLLNKLGLKVWCLYDDDNNKESPKEISHKKLNEVIENLKSSRALINTYAVPTSIEDALNYRKEQARVDIGLYNRLCGDVDGIKSNSEFEKIVNFIKQILKE